MATNIQAALRKIAGAQVNQGGNFIRGGTYLLEVEKLIMEQKRKGMCFIGELRVIESADTATSLKGEEIKANKVGERVGEVQNLDGKGADSAPGNIKAFVCALLGADPNATDEEELFEALQGTEENGEHIAGLLEPSQPMRGKLIRCEAFEKPTKAGNPFTVKNWSYVEQAPEDIQARRKAQDERAKAAA